MTPAARRTPPTEAAAAAASVTTASTANHHNTVVAKVILEELLTSLSTDVALQIHRLLKTGGYPASEGMLEDRRFLYPPECYPLPGKPPVKEEEDTSNSKDQKDATEDAHTEATKRGEEGMAENKDPPVGSSNNTPVASVEAVDAACHQYSVDRPVRKRRKTLDEQAVAAEDYYGKYYLAASRAWVVAARAEKTTKDAPAEDAVVAESPAEAAAEAVPPPGEEAITDVTMTEAGQEEDIPKEEATKIIDKTVPEDDTATKPEEPETPVTRGKQPPSGYGTRSKQPLLSRQEPEKEVENDPQDPTPGPVAPPPHTGKQPPASRAPHSDQPVTAVKPNSITSGSPVPTATTARATTPLPSPMPPSTTNTNTSATTHLDIYGRQRPKEPPNMIPCHVCGRQVNTLRYAPHLDKCLGIGTTVRAAALAASGFTGLPVTGGGGGGGGGKLKKKQKTSHSNSTGASSGGGGSSKK